MNTPADRITQAILEFEWDDYGLDEVAAIPPEHAEYAPMLAERIITALGAAALGNLRIGEVREAARRAGREDVLNAAADDLDAIAQRALQDGRENAGLDAYSGVKQVAAWLRARAGLTPAEARRKERTE